MNESYLLRNVEVSGVPATDVRIGPDGLVAEVGPSLPLQDEDRVVDGGGGALLPGLHDHHLHLAATAAKADSIDLAGLDRSRAVSALRAAEPGHSGWIRAVGFDDEVHGDLTRDDVDLIRSDRPLRIQHRGGSLWVLNSTGLAVVNAGSDGHPGVETDSTGRLTGRLWRADDWLGRRIRDDEAPSLVTLGQRLASLGITGVADASPALRPATLAAEAVHRGDLPQRVMLMAADVQPEPHPRLSIGPAKVVVADHDLPGLDALASQIEALHQRNRPVAVHCVTRVALILTLAAFDIAGIVAGDRIEHCAVADGELVTRLAERGLVVVTQPSLLRDRGDEYWERTEAADKRHLWPYGGLLAAGVAVAPSSDAPYGDLDPWASIRAASERLTTGGRLLGAEQRVSRTTALAGFLSPLDAPGGAVRVVERGAPADLVLLHVPLDVALADPSQDNVRATYVAGSVAFD